MYNEPRDIVIEEGTFQILITIIDDLVANLEEHGQDMSDLEYELNVLFSQGGEYEPNAYNEMKEELYRIDSNE